ncbi:hypothetical protein MMC09_001989 [Bachmanniomyces sp. S44760]|nr:hypothetical protein [Bachmanniomyces sp. S44760]
MAEISVHNGANDWVQFFGLTSDTLKQLANPSHSPRDDGDEKNSNSANPTITHEWHLHLSPKKSKGQKEEPHESIKTTEDVSLTSQPQSAGSPTLGPRKALLANPGKRVSPGRQDGKNDVTAEVCDILGVITTPCTPKSTLSKETNHGSAVINRHGNDIAPATATQKLSPSCANHLSLVAAQHAIDVVAPGADLTGPNVFDAIFGTDVASNVQGQRDRCVAFNTGKVRHGLRCGWTIKWKSSDLVKTLYERFTSVSLRADTDECEKRLQELVKIVYCDRHETKARAKITEWKTHEDASNLSNISFVTSTSRTAQVATPATGTVTVKSSVAKDSVIPIRSTVPKKVDESTTKKSGKAMQPAFDTQLFNFNAATGTASLKPGTTLTWYKQDMYLWCPRSIAEMSEAEAVRSALGINLSQRDPDEVTSGFVYVYSFPGNFGLIKIGFTTRDPKVRLDEWKEKCKHEAILEYPKEPQDVRKIKHAGRVERLVHTELKNFRMKEVKCKACGQEHEEWFRTSHGHAKAVVQKFSEWIEQKPYVDQGSSWALKQEFRRDTEEICRPVDLQVPKSEKALVKRAQVTKNNGLEQVILRRSDRLGTKQTLDPRKSNGSSSPTQEPRIDIKESPSKELDVPVTKSLVDQISGLKI